jgi:hypothetical protein
MAISQAMVTSFKVEILNGIHAFGTTVVRAGTTADTFKIALYTSSATLDATTTAYTTSNEVPSTGNYSAGGNTLTTVAPTSTGTTAFLDFNDTTWATSTITARGALIYNDIQSDKAVAVLDFGSDRSSSGGNFTIQFPAADATNAILRIA